MTKAFYRRRIKLENKEEESEQIEIKKNIEDIYNNSVNKIQDINKKLFDLVEQRNILIKNNLLIKLINNLNNTYNNILRNKLFDWYDNSEKIRIKAENIIAHFLQKKYQNFKEIKIKNKLINMFNILEEYNTLELLKYYIIKWNNQCYREKKLEKFLYLIEIKTLIYDVQTLGNIFLTKNLFSQIYVARAKSFFDNLYNLYIDKTTINNNYYLGLLITKDFIYNYLRSYLNLLRLNCQIIKEEKYNTIIKDLTEKISKLDKNNALKTILEKEEEIKKLKESLSRYPFELQKGEKIMSVIFTSIDQKVNCSIICKNTDYFSEIVNLLYKKYPEYRKNDCFFLYASKKIKEYLTLEELKINDGAVIILNEID